MTAFWSFVLAAHAHGGVDSDDDGWTDSAEQECGSVDDPTSFPGARERCDGIDNDCDYDVDEDGACVDEILPCYQIETRGREQRALDGDPCLLAANPDAGACGGSASDSGAAFLLVGLLAFRRRRA
jgi:hypothetical protein